MLSVTPRAGRAFGQHGHPHGGSSSPQPAVREPDGRRSPWRSKRAAQPSTAAQTPPAPTASSTGAPPTSIVSTTLRRRTSTSDTVRSSRLATQRPSSPSARRIGTRPTLMRSVDLARCGRRPWRRCHPAALPPTRAASGGDAAADREREARSCRAAGRVSRRSSTHGNRPRRPAPRRSRPRPPCRTGTSAGCRRERLRKESHTSARPPARPSRPLVARRSGHPRGPYAFGPPAAMLHEFRSSAS